MSSREYRLVRLKGEKSDLTHGFVIVMRGLVLDMLRDKKRVWLQGSNLVVITPASFEKWAITASQCVGAQYIRTLTLCFVHLRFVVV